MGPNHLENAEQYDLHAGNADPQLVIALALMDIARSLRSIDGWFNAYASDCLPVRVHP
ncbi:Uncharacterised protein [Mycobacteroides abscessus subsp. abscessus]|nr:Uncharacterised protein [Mycobacteroides abscessus subsp. abscessus]SHT05484.1 Uncharacterised protein [Mycobacteroides abscessus subsp. abscessus]SHT22923.1 Uncharacterised protein [Mycobacteroides abscessus subsp. abscessus]SHU58074.1 Uncharacterised protein [Mycobacteroides abscessus subsp. abscessus]SHV39071.1 Uncharacterised protein [Mycobacteroides abscessus subsp. abscessus]